MKRIIAILLALIITASDTTISAQSSKPTRRLSPVSGYITSPFDSNIDKLPANFRGHYIEGVYLAIKALTPPRGEYEKTGEYFARLAQHAGKKQYAFRYDPEIDKGWVKYDADAGTLKVSGYSLGVFECEFTSHYVTMELQKLSRTVGGSYPLLDSKDSISYYIASNSFGRKVRVKRARRISYKIADNKKLPDWHFELKVAPAEAYRLKPSLSVLFVCDLAISKIVPLMTFEYIYHSEPTISEPEEYIVTERCLMVNVREIWLFNRQTGEVYQRQKLES
ncbi:MAG TPA: hypothetical protein VJ464_16025 [Blastocatellia bacterium]|nr:hypothetical protein [Blastocatellia bacterium]